MKNEKEIKVFKKLTVVEMFDIIYEFIYDGNISEEEEYKLVDEYDNRMNKNDTFYYFVINKLNPQRDDFIISDREAASALLLWKIKMGEDGYNVNSIDTKYFYKNL